MSDLRKRIEEEAPKKTNYFGLSLALIGSLILFTIMIWFIVPRGEPKEVSAVDRIDPYKYDPSTDSIVNENSTLQESDGLSTDSSSDSKNGVDYREAVDVGLYSWKVVDEDTVAANRVPKYPEIVEDRALVKLNNNLWSKDVGEIIQFSIPQREEVLIGTITSADTDQVNYRSLEGTITEGGKEYTFVVTLGERRSFAHIRTMTGNYELVANDSYGWLMPTDKMDEHVDYSVPDHFLPDPDPHSHTLTPEPPEEQ